MHSIKCGHCSTYNRPVYHRNSAAVRACARAHHNGSQYANTRVQVPQPIGVAPMSQVTQPTPAPNTWRFKTPRAMVEAMRDGRYAVSPEGGEEFSQHVFVRVSRPKHGKRKGCLVIQTQHSDDYRPLLIIWPSGGVTFFQTADRIDMALLLVAADPFTSALKYAHIKKVCSRCGKQLTDARSRYYGIGPECEKYWPEIVNLVNETRGVFVS